MHIEFEDNMLDTCCSNTRDMYWKTSRLPCQTYRLWLGSDGDIQDNPRYFFKALGKIPLYSFNYSITAFKTACFLTNGSYHTMKFNYRSVLCV